MDRWKIPLTAEQEAAYVENGGQACPSCGSGDLEGEELVYQKPGLVWQSMTCVDCGCAWHDQYTLSAIDPCCGEDA